MSKSQKDDSPVFQLHINGSAVTVKFSSIETTDIKARVRDILTEIYEERLQNTEYHTGIHATRVRGR